MTFRRYAEGVMARNKLTGRQAAVLAFMPGLLLVVGMASANMLEAGPAAVIALTLCAGCWWLTRNRLGDRAERSGPLPVPASEVPQALLDQLPDPILLLNAAREIVAVNAPAREELGIELLGRDLALSLRHPEVLATVEAVLSGGSSAPHEVTLPVPVARTFTLHAAGLSASADVRKPRVVLLLRDETRAKRAEQSRADFVASASHELRSPLAALIGLIETLRGPARDDTAARDRFLVIMQAEALRMTRLVEDLLWLSRVEINEHVPPRDRVDVRELLAAVADTLTVRAEQRGMAIDLDLPEDLPEVIGDPDQLTQVFHNLVDNAVKYGRAGTHVHIIARIVDPMPAAHGTGISVAVTNEGDGIEPIHLPRLTERFYRADKGRSRQLGGTGLGLAIVKHIVNRHRGRLTVESTLGKGSTFAVLLPGGAAVPHLPQRRTLDQLHANAEPSS